MEQKMSRLSPPFGSSPSPQFLCDTPQQFCRAWGAPTQNKEHRITQGHFSFTPLITSSLSLGLVFNAPLTLANPPFLPTGQASSSDLGRLQHWTGFQWHSIVLIKYVLTFAFKLQQMKLIFPFTEVHLLRHSFLRTLYNLFTYKMIQNNLLSISHMPVTVLDMGDRAVIRHINTLLSWSIQSIWGNQALNKLL